MSNLPIFRAKRIDSDKYVEGFYIPYNDKNCYIGHRDIVCISNRLESEDKIDVRAIKCDMTTLSIHHADMLASDSDRYLPNGEKDLRIFASLQEDGKGGDMVKKLDTTFEATHKYIKGKFLLDNNMDIFNPYVKFKTIGIQE